MGKKESGQTRHGKTCLQCPSNLEELKKILEVDTLPGSKTNQEIFLQWVQQKFQERGDLEWLRKDKSFQLARLADTEKDSEEDLEKIARRARFNGFIQPLNLARLLAAEEDSEDILPRLWEDFGCYGSRGKIKTDTPNALKFGWYKFILRITGIDRATPEGHSGRVGA